MKLYFEPISVMNWMLLPQLFSSLFFVLGERIKYPPKVKVCVIGAGPAGIATTRQLAKNLDKFDITVFERGPVVGNFWHYTDETGIDKYGYPVHSSIHKTMRTNAPKELMNLPDWPVYKGVNTSTVIHSVIVEYLKNYTEHFKLQRMITLNTIVTNVKLYRRKNMDKWKVTVKNLRTSRTKKFIFDYVIVCTGHNSMPNIPKIPGLEHFKGMVMHSHNYRRPECFRNKKVIVLGASTSGREISLDLVNFASKVYLSHNYEKMPIHNLTQIKGVDRFENGKFILKDNSSVEADVILFSTGYVYSFPFLDDSTGITVNDKYILPIYKRIINILHPSMSFIGLPRDIGYFPRVYMQAQFIAAFLNGKIKLPPKEEMLENASSNKSVNKNFEENLLDSWKYPEELARLGGFPPLPEYYKFGTEAWAKLAETDINNYKDYTFVLSKDKKSVKIFKP